MLGVDLVIPDANYLVKNKDKIKGILLTHGHEDHIGALPYVLHDINVPIYGTKLTLGLVNNRLKEHNLSEKIKLITVNPADVVQLGVFKTEFIRVNHSIPGSVAVAIYTPVGVVFHTGDYKIDTTPIDGDMINLGRIAELGKQGVLLMMSDSTNVEREGFSMSERTVGASFDDLFKNCEKRIIVATFASNVHRMQQIFDSAAKHKRKVAVSGRSMENVLTVASELGYIKIQKNILISIDEITRYNPEQLVIITTGSQGEAIFTNH
jgi:ribonuclease J